MKATFPANDQKIVLQDISPLIGMCQKPLDSSLIDGTHFDAKRSIWPFPPDVASIVGEIALENWKFMPIQWPFPLTREVPTSKPVLPLRQVIFHFNYFRVTFKPREEPKGQNAFVLLQSSACVAVEVSDSSREGLEEATTQNLDPTKNHKS